MTKIHDLWEHPQFSTRVMLVGGAVRDKLLHLEPKDRDWVIVGATPADVQNLIELGYTQVGADFPVFLHPSTNEEYALARVERKTGAGYAGFEVQADASVTIEQDLARRDLSINSMAMDKAGNLIDPYGGLKDLHNHVLRHTSVAFAEDPLRILRLARFAARYKDFSVDQSTIELCKKISAQGELNHLSIERIWVELEKGFSEEFPDRFVGVLERSEALRHCTMLSDLFGYTVNPVQSKASKLLSNVKADARLAVSVAALSIGLKPAKSFSGISSRVAVCCDAVQAMRSSAHSLEDFAKLLKNTGALRDGHSFDDFIQAVMVLEAAGDLQMCFSSRKLIHGAQIMRDVKAAEFPGLSGKALGEAISAARLTRLAFGTGITE